MRSKILEEVIAETPDYIEFKNRIKRKTGIDLNLYKQQQMHRRLLSLLERSQSGNFLDYFTFLEKNVDEWQVFLDRMTINVSELFRNPEKWEVLRRPILTEWLTDARPAAGTTPRGLKVWSAGCSYGAEPYSLALLLDQAVPNARHTIHATDLDRTILAKAREGQFTRADVKNVAPALLERYFTLMTARGGEAARGTLPLVSAARTADAERMAHTLEAAYQVKDEIRRRITFLQQNLLADRFEDGFDLICCRNVVIYFTDEAKATLYKRFHDALRPGGVLFVGGTERIFNAREMGFEMPLPFFYRRAC
jgi:chemotaxis protein methyltransferase CheR